MTATLSGLIFLAATQLCFVKFTNATPLPYSNYIRVSPPAKPSITILSPAENNALRSSNNLTISFKANIKSESSVDVWILSVHYTRSWKPNNITLWERSDYNPFTPPVDDIREYSGNLSLTGIPEGNQTVTITVYGGGSYSENLVLYYFDAVSYCTVGFTVDTVPPKVSVLELDNKTFVEPEIPLNFTVNEAVSKIVYALDGQENVTVAGNTTLTGLAVGEHNVTAYAVDAAGNTGTSETVWFSVAEPFPVVPIAAASGVAITAAVACAF